MKFNPLKRFKKNSNFDVSNKFNFEFSTKEDNSSEDVYIEGYANRAVRDDGTKVVDRGREHIPSKEWMVDEWMKNPVIFFNHDRDMIIGKGVAAEIREEGLWIKVKISNSDDPGIKKVRDLIKEGILKTFSVGIDIGSEEVDKDGTLILKRVNLLETSVVSIPMNQESFFSISQKSLEKDSTEKIHARILKAKGALVAAAIHNRISEMMQADKDFSRAEALAKVASDAGVSSVELFDILSGNTLSIEEDILQSFASNFEMNFEELEKLNKQDIQNADPDSDLLPEDEEEVEEELEENEEKPEDEPKPEDEDEEEKKAKALDEKISKLILDSLTSGKNQDVAISEVILEVKKEFDQTLSKRNWDTIFKSVEDFNKKEMSQTTNGLEASLQAQLQTNILLSQMIGKFDELNKTLESLKPLMGVPDPIEDDQELMEEEDEEDTLSDDEELTDEENKGEEEEEEEENTKTLDILNNYSANLKKKLEGF